MRITRLPGLPLRAQVLALTFSSILVAQGMTVAAVLLLPPPDFQVYRPADIAAVVRAPAKGRDFGRRLVVRDMDASPLTRRGDDDHDLIFADALARELGAPSSRVRFKSSPPPGFRGWRVGPSGPPPPTRGPPWGTVERSVGAGMLSAIDFVATVRLPDGRWRVVRPETPYHLHKRLLGWLLVVLVLVGPIAWWFADRISRPVKSFALAAEALGRDPRRGGVAIEGPAEIGVAARAFNAMQERLRRYINDRLSVMGAISHDLRTPLTRMRFKLEAAPAAVRADVVADLEYMERMIDQILNFVRGIDHVTPREAIDLGALLSTLCDEMADMGHDVRYRDGGATLVVEADALALRRALENLLDNAVKYGRRAVVDLTLQENMALVTIEDEGDGLHPDQFEAMFQPFRRGQARSADATGVGLGLTTARSIVRGHGGDIRLAPGAVGLRVEVSLPVLS